jgi:hypothetical protein
VSAYCICVCIVLRAVLCCTEISMYVYCCGIDIKGGADVNFVMCWTEVGIFAYCFWIDITDCTDVNIPKINMCSAQVIVVEAC